MRARYGDTTWTELTPGSADDAMRVSIAPDGDALAIEATYDAHVPYFWWFFNPQIRGSVRAHLRHIVAELEAAASGRSEPPPLKRPAWAPPESMTRDQSRMIATISLLMALAEYGSTLLNQTVDYVAKTYGATDAQLGVVSSVTRVGNLVVIVGGLLADRIGRRRLLLITVSLILVCTTLSAAAPTLLTFGALQVIVNGSTNLALMVGFIVAVEEAPEGSRTYTIAIVGIASGLGFIVPALLLPTADISRDAWRGMYAIAALGFVFFPSLRRNLRESHRFEALRARHADTGRVGEVVDKRYGPRFVLLCVSGFMLSFFFAPQAQFTNRYLRDTRGFSGGGILMLRTATQLFPSFLGAYAGGKLAESRGRVRTARFGLLVGAAGIALFFFVGGPVLWITLAIGTLGLGLYGPSHGAFTTELFPTEVRGTAGAFLTVTAVLGSASGLLLAGFLSDPLGGIGHSVAVLAFAPLLVAIFLFRHLPEAKGKLLDEVSPSEV